MLLQNAGEMVIFKREIQGEKEFFTFGREDLGILHRGTNVVIALLLMILNHEAVCEH